MWLEVVALLYVCCHYTSRVSPPAIMTHTRFSMALRGTICITLFPPGGRTKADIPSLAHVFWDLTLYYCYDCTLHSIVVLSIPSFSPQPRNESLRMRVPPTSRDITSSPAGTKRSSSSYPQTFCRTQRAQTVNLLGGMGQQRSGATINR